MKFGLGSRQVGFPVSSWSSRGDSGSEQRLVARTDAPVLDPLFSGTWQGWPEVRRTLAEVAAAILRGMVVTEKQELKDEDGVVLTIC